MILNVITSQINSKQKRCFDHGKNINCLSPRYKPERYTFDEIKDTFFNNYMYDGHNKSFCKEVFNLLKNYSVAFHKVNQSYYTPNSKIYNFVYYVDDKINLEIEASSIFHQLSHIVEMQDNSRLLKNNFGFNMFLFRPEKLSNNGILKAVAREARVFGIQKHFIKLVNVNFSLGIDDLRLPLGKFKSNKDLTDWARYIQDSTYNNYSQDRIIFELKEKLNYIQNNLQIKNICA